MWAFCRSRPLMRDPDARSTASDARGFTLLEVLVVLVIVSVTGAVVFPHLTNMAASFEFATQRDTFEQTLSGLPYQVYRDNSDMILLGSYTAAGRDQRKPQASSGETLAASMRTRSLIPEAREHLPPVNANYIEVPLPAGWEVVVKEPIYYRGSGYCSGGTVEVFVGRLEYSYLLRPPLCRAELME